MDEHRYYGVNVKVGMLPTVPGEDELRELIGEDGLQAVYDGLAETYWISLSEQAKQQFGVEAVYSEGRMGGWAVPCPHIDPEEEPAKFAAFADLATGELDYYVNALWPEYVAERLAEIKAEEVERAEMEARDIVTREVIA